MRDYTGKTIYLGIDVHKKTYSVTAVCEKQRIKRDTLVAEPEGLIKYCKKFFPGAEIISAYETGFCGFSLHRKLEVAGINNLVVHAAGIELAAGNRVKTDKIDSEKIAIQLEAGRLKGVQIPTEERENYRVLTRLRERHIKRRTKISNQIKSLFFMNGLIKAGDDRRVSAKWIANLKLDELSEELQYTIREETGMWLDLTQKIKELEEKIKQQAVKDEKLEMVYRSVPGVGAVSARVLANELGDGLQFRNERQLFSYTGLTPSEHSSGEHIRQGHITRQGKAVIRKILVQVAWTTIKKDQSLKKIFERMKERVGAKRAIIGIARRLIGRIRACFRTGSLYYYTTEESIAA